MLTVFGQTANLTLYLIKLYLVLFGRRVWTGSVTLHNSKFENQAKALTGPNKMDKLQWLLQKALILWCLCYQFVSYCYHHHHILRLILEQYTGLGYKILAFKIKCSLKSKTDFTWTNRGVLRQKERLCKVWALKLGLGKKSNSQWFFLLFSIILWTLTWHNIFCCFQVAHFTLYIVRGVLTFQVVLCFGQNVLRTPMANDKSIYSRNMKATAVQNKFLKYSLTTQQSLHMCDYRNAIS